MRKLLLIPVLLILASCASLRQERLTFVPPRIDCAVTDMPRAKVPGLPSENTIPAWQLYAWGWQAVADDIMGQRVETAACIAKLRQQGLVK